MSRLWLALLITLALSFLPVPVGAGAALAQVAECNTGDCSAVPLVSSLAASALSTSVSGINDPSLISPRTVYDFSSDPLLSSPSSFPGGTFSGTGQITIVGNGWGTWNPPSPGKHLLYAPNGAYTISFTTPQVAVGVVAQPNPYGYYGITIQAFDASNNSLGSYTRSINGYAGAAFLGLMSSSANIASVSLTSSVDFAFSDLTYGGTVANRAPTANAGGPYVGNEGSPIALTGTASDADGDPLVVSWAVAPAAGTDAGTACAISNANTLTPTIICSDDGTFTATLTASDGKASPVSASASVVVANVAPTLNIASPAADQVVALSATIGLSATFADGGTNDVHTCTIAWGDGSTVAGSVSETGGSGTCTGSKSFAGGGIYTIQATATDDDGASVSKAVTVVVYEPNGGFATGGGWIDSPAGAVKADPSAAGKAAFGFVARRLRVAEAPAGQTEFQAANLDFHSSSYSWLMVSGGRAVLQGMGTVNGTQGYSFLLTALSAETAAGGADRFGIRITDSSGTVVYDNIPPGGSGIYDATPQAIAGGSVVIHGGN